MDIIIILPFYILNIRTIHDLSAVITAHGVLISFGSGVNVVVVKFITYTSWDRGPEICMNSTDFENQHHYDHSS